jgi:predicted nucleotidyltransferase
MGKRSRVCVLWFRIRRIFGAIMKSLKSIPLQKNDCLAIETAVATIKKEFPIETVILFGSKSRGGGDVHSDTDLLLVTKRPLHWREEKAVIKSLFDIGMAFDVIFSPLFASHDEWEDGVFQNFPVYADIMRDGALVS